MTYECIRAFYATADADEEDIILHDKGTVESKLDTAAPNSLNLNVPCI
jgi:hypothetical protein